MLVVVKHRDLHSFPQLPLDVEAFRCLDVFQIDAAKRRFQHGNGIYQFVWIRFGHLDIEDVDAGELLE